MTYTIMVCDPEGDYEFETVVDSSELSGEVMNLTEAYIDKYPGYYLKIMANI